MKKGSKLSDINYSVEIRDLDRPIPTTFSGSSLRDLLRQIADSVPTMDNYSKVYREMRYHVGVYMGLFTLPVPGKKPRQVVVTIMSDTTTEADIDRFHAYAATLPQYTPDVAK
jgi:hypothetical protein